MKALALALTLAALSAPAGAVRWDQSPAMPLDDGTEMVIAIDLDSIDATHERVLADFRLRNLDKVHEEYFRVLVPGRVCNAGAGKFAIYDADGKITAKPVVDRSNPNRLDILAMAACFGRASILGLSKPDFSFERPQPTRGARRNQF